MFSNPVTPCIDDAVQGRPALIFCHHPPVLDIGSEGFKHGDNLFDADGVDALAVSQILLLRSLNPTAASAGFVRGRMRWRRSQPT